MTRPVKRTKNNQCSFQLMSCVYFALMTWRLGACIRQKALMLSGEQSAFPVSPFPSSHDHLSLCLLSPLPTQAHTPNLTKEVTGKQWDAGNGQRPVSVTDTP